MAGRSVARRYAREAFEVAESHREIERWESDLRTIAGVLLNPAFREYLESPAVPFPPKRQVLDEALAGIGPLSRNFAYTIVSNRRVDEVPAIVAEFDRLARERAGVAIAQVTTAVPLDEREAAAVARRLGEITDRRVVIERSVDPAIIGGIIARIGDREIDGSVRTRLTALRRQLSQ
jgi:F-type H+-transporting ATPase subunit delta